MSETNEDVKVEKTNPLEGDEGIGGVAVDEKYEEDEGGAVVEPEGEGVEAIDENGEVGVAEKKVVEKTGVEEATAPLVEGTS